MIGADPEWYSSANWPGASEPPAFFASRGAGRLLARLQRSRTRSTPCARITAPAPPTISASTRQISASGRSRARCSFSGARRAWSAAFTTRWRSGATGRAMSGAGDRRRALPGGGAPGRDVASTSGFPAARGLKIPGSAARRHVAPFLALVLRLRHRFSHRFGDLMAEHVHSGPDRCAPRCWPGWSWRSR